MKQIMVDGKEVLAVFPKVKKDKQPFVKIYPGAFLPIIVDVQQTKGINLRILIYLLNLVDYDNKVAVTHTEISIELGISRQCAWKTITKLIQLGILTKIRHGLYQVSVTFVRKGGL